MRIREQIALWTYLGAVNVLIPLGVLLGLPFLLLKKKRRKTLFKRLGFQSLPSFPVGTQPVWVHALSLGETLSCVSLIEELRVRLGERPIVFSVSTLSAMEIARERIRPHVQGIFYFPLDLWWPVSRTLRKVSPRMIVFIETDLWPGIQYQISRSRIPELLVNGRLSPDTYRACLRFRSLFAPALNCFQCIFPQSDREAERYVQVGVLEHKLARVGNLKFDVANRVPSFEELSRIRAATGINSSERILLAGSTHSGEERAVIEAFQIVRKNCPALRLIVVPRHPVRAGEVQSIVERSSLRAQLYSQVDADSRWDVLIVDVMGILAKLYHLAMASFIGGSLVNKGGQNPLESAAAGCPCMFGPDMSDFPDVAAAMLEVGAATQVADAGDLAERWSALVMQPNHHNEMTHGCKRFIRARCGVTASIADEIADLLKRKEREY